MIKRNELLADPEIRRAYEEELLIGEVSDTISALLESLGLSQRELAQRVGVTEGRISQILSGSGNVTLRTLAATGWALGVRFELDPVPMQDTAGTPATNDPAPPMWLTRLRPTAELRYQEGLSVPPPGDLVPPKRRLQDLYPEAA